MPGTWKPQPLWKRPRTWLAVCACAVYLIVTGWFLLLHILGDSVSRPVAYFFTWDMFPYYASQNVQRIAIGQTSAGDFVQLYPGPADQFRRGTQKQFSRIDLLGRPEADPVRALVFRPIERNLAEYQQTHSEEPMTRMILAERFWPHRMNYLDPFFEKISGPRAQREAGWKVLEELPVSPDGAILRDE